MPSGGSTLLLPSDQKSAKKKRESQSKKEKKRARSTFETRPATVPRGFSFSWKWWNQKRKKKGHQIWRERGNECFFLHPTKQPTRSGQWTLSSSYDFSAAAAASCYKSDHPRYENDTAERDKLYRKVYSLVVTREPTAKTPIHPEMLSLRRRQYTDSFRERSRDFSFFVYVFARLSSYMIGREVWRAPCTTQPNKRNGFPATHRCSPFGTHTWRWPASSSSAWRRSDVTADVSLLLLTAR